MKVGINMKKLLAIIITVATVITLTVPTFAMSPELRQAQAAEQALYENEITFRGIPWGSTVSQVKMMLSDICNPDDLWTYDIEPSGLIVNVTNNVIYTLNPIPELMTDDYEWFLALEMALVTESCYDEYEDCGANVIDDITVAGHKIEKVFLQFIDTDLDLDTEPVLCTAIYEFDVESECGDDYFALSEVYNDINDKLCTLYAFSDNYSASTELVANFGATYRDYIGNTCCSHLYYDKHIGENNEIVLNQAIQLYYCSGQTGTFADMQTTTYYNNLHATWDTNGL